MNGCAFVIEVAEGEDYRYCDLHPVGKFDGVDLCGAHAPRFTS